MLLQYYGIDWLAMVLTFLAIWLIGDRNKSGFFLMIGGNTCWVVLGVMTASVALVLANLSFMALNVRAIVHWSRPANRKPAN